MNKTDVVKCVYTVHSNIHVNNGNDASFKEIKSSLKWSCDK